MDEGIVRAEQLAHFRQRPAEPYFFIFGVDRRGGKQALLELRQARVGELGQAVRVRLRAFLGAAHQLARVGEITAGEGPRALDFRMLRLDIAIDLLRPFYRVPCAARLGPQGGPRSDEGTQIAFFLVLLLHQRGVEQRFQLAEARLKAVFDAEEIVFRDARRFRSQLAVLFEDTALFGKAQQAADQTDIAKSGELRRRQLALGRARVTRDEDQLARLGARLAEREKVLHLRRLAVFVGAQQRDVEVVAREVEVVRIAAEKRDRLFRNPGQADILEAVIRSSRLSSISGQRTSSPRPRARKPSAMKFFFALESWLTHAAAQW